MKFLIDMPLSPDLVQENTGTVYVFPAPEMGSAPRNRRKQSCGSIGEGAARCALCPRRNAHVFACIFQRCSVYVPIIPVARSAFGSRRLPSGPFVGPGGCDLKLFIQPAREEAPLRRRSNLVRRTIQSCTNPGRQTRSRRA